MSNDTIENGAATQPAPEKPKAKSKATNKAKPVKKAKPAKKRGSKTKAERSNKKAKVIALMMRTKGATLAEIMKATGWQAHTVRGFVSVLGKKGVEHDRPGHNEG